MIFNKNKKKNTNMEPKEENINGQNPETTNEELEQTAAETAEATATDDTREEEQTEKHNKKKHGHHLMDEVEEKLQQLGEKLAEKEDQYKRLYADFENHRKRTNTEKADLILNGGKEVIKSLLPVIDDLERALQSMTDENAKEGVQLIYNKLMKTLEQKGLKPMEAKGEKFNEELHEAITRVPAASEEQKGEVIDVVEKGYFLNDKVLRFAKVVVAY